MLCTKSCYEEDDTDMSFTFRWSLVKGGDSRYDQNYLCFDTGHQRLLLTNWRPSKEGCFSSNMKHSFISRSWANLFISLVLHNHWSPH